MKKFIIFFITIFFVNINSMQYKKEYLDEQEKELKVIQERLKVISSQIEKFKKSPMEQILYIMQAKDAKNEWRSIYKCLPEDRKKKIAEELEEEFK